MNDHTTAPGAAAALFHATDYPFPDLRGHFGPYGGSFVAETLTHALAELKDAYARYSVDPEFLEEFRYELKHFVGRPSPIYHAKRWSELAGGAQIYFKREDLNHTGAHKINNVIGQALLAKRMGKPRIIAETGAGQHGVATATICARFGLEYAWLKDLGRAQYVSITDDEALQAFHDCCHIEGIIPALESSHALAYAAKLAATLPKDQIVLANLSGRGDKDMVRDFQSVIGEECLVQMPEMTGRQPDYVLACIGGGSNAMGIFYPYIDQKEVKLIGVEAAGEGLDTGKHSASLTAGFPGVLHGNRTYLLQDENGQIIETHSVSAGLDYPGVGPEHAWLKDSGRAQYVSITDDEALQAFHDCCHIEGIIPALESSHALAYAAKLAATLPKDQIVLANLSGRGDKDMHTVAERMGLNFS